MHTHVHPNLKAGAKQQTDQELESSARALVNVGAGRASLSFARLLRPTRSTARQTRGWERGGYTLSLYSF